MSDKKRGTFNYPHIQMIRIMGEKNEKVFRITNL